MPFASDVVNTATSRTMDALDVNGEIRERIPFSGPRKKGLASLNIQKAQKDEDEETDGAFPGVSMDFYRRQGTTGRGRSGACG